MSEFVLLQTKDRYTVTSCSILDSFYNIREDINSYYAASYFSAVCQTLIQEEQPDEKLYSIFAKLLAYMAHSESNALVNLIIAMCTVLDISGFKMDMSYSYKPVLLKAVFEHIDEKGRVNINDLVDYFIDYYSSRKENGLVVEKKPCIYKRDDYTRKEVERNIFSNPFKRFEDMNFMKRSKDIEYIEVNKHIMKKLTSDDIKWIIMHCDERLEEYFGEDKHI